MTMQMSQGGIDALLKKFEGCKLSSYRCPANVLTVGYGHTSAAGAPEGSLPGLLVVKTGRLVPKARRAWRAVRASTVL
jgi:GH24 family phage-related lysozyme (muramidase)